MAENYEGLSLIQMETRNAERSEALARQGVGVQVGNAYLESLLETLLGERVDEARLAYQRRVGEALDHAEQELFKIRLGVRAN